MREFPLRGRAALVTGVSRRAGIAFAVAERLAGLGADVLAQSWEPHDAEQPWGADPLGVIYVIEELRRRLPGGAGRIEHVAADFAEPEAPAAVVDATVAAFGAIDVVVAAHARSSGQGLAELTAAELDLTYAVNVRGSMLLAQRFDAVRDHSRPGGRIVLFTSGQHYGAMPGELPYVASKGALQQVTASLAGSLAAKGVTVNCVNPGPVDTGYADEELREHVVRRMPMGRWGRPEDTADLIGWLVSDGGAWITGQTLVSDGGWGLRI
ncbi:SDR family oxidoreductase [Allokutzneria sp. A3M-2-11 16]|uniref:SDR family oxidoreductase n=1 Tax=Allokutzneria sp. A3M-2-11 16 TaxID=2962043 RepID=UPI0020B7A22E|nr:SDR family oxidoreductase [Allokutzneria sp. A3M-2-11 16]MCP3799069.1 SDR family oxidoreductase [Allokutzneria sp. A3M-2-11 16]